MKLGKLFARGVVHARTDGKRLKVFVLGGKSEDFPSACHEETAVPERCSDADYPPA